MPQSLDCTVPSSSMPPAYGPWDIPNPRTNRTTTILTLALRSFVQTPFHLRADPQLQYYTRPIWSVNRLDFFTAPIGSEKLGTDAYSASGSTSESVLCTQAPPRGIDVFSCSGPGRHTSPTPVPRDSGRRCEHARRQDGRESLATEEDSASRSTTTANVLFVQKRRRPNPSVRH
jgi:hypothetical protein